MRQHGGGSSSKSISCTYTDKIIQQIRPPYEIRRLGVSGDLSELLLIGQSESLNGTTERNNDLLQVGEWFYIRPKENG